MMHKVVAFGGCHILSGSYNNLNDDKQTITVDKKIPCQLCNKTGKSIQVLHNYLNANKNDEVTIVFQTGNFGFSNSIGNIIGFGTGRKVVQSIIPVTFNDNEFFQQTTINSSSKPGLKIRLIQLLYLFIIPINFLVITFVYIPRLIHLKNAIKKHSNVCKVLVITPFSAYCNFHWIFRKYGAWVYPIVFRSAPVFNMLDMYSPTHNESLFIADKLHLNPSGYQVLNQAICDRLFELGNILAPAC